MEKVFYSTDRIRGIKYRILKSENKKLVWVVEHTEIIDEDRIKALVDVIGENDGKVYELMGYITDDFPAWKWSIREVAEMVKEGIDSRGYW